MLRLKRTEDLLALQRKTSEQPYSILHRLSLASAYQCLGYPDLAVGDAYKALLLIDEVSEDAEYHDEAMDAANVDYLTERLARLCGPFDDQACSSTEDDIISWVRSDCSKRAYDILIRCLLDCGCLRSALDFVLRATKALPDEPCLKEYQGILSQKLHAYFEAKGEQLDDVDVEDYPDKGFVRRENYPWNEHEPNRYSAECMEYLKEELENVAPKLEVRIVELPLLSGRSEIPESKSHVEVVKQLGLFAKEDIFPGEQILEEKSLLTAISRLYDTYCDACSALLSTSTSPTSTGDGRTVVPCEECYEVFFCSVDCHDLAQNCYHPSLCGVSIGQDKVSAREAADYLYTLLLIRALALAETRDVHPLDLKEVRYVWGDYHSVDLDHVYQVDPAGNLSNPFSSLPQTLPFSFKNNVLAPLHLLEKMDVNIFTRDDRYDTWVFNTLYAKFRGTASAQQGLDGRPEIGAVHPIWCLANHSCDPNVAWEWQGSMRFWARKELVDWRGRDTSRRPGLSKGEEVLSHYCDVNLPVKERREWAVGALGGECVCPRCIWEAAKDRPPTEVA